MFDDCHIHYTPCSHGAVSAGIRGLVTTLTDQLAVPLYCTWLRSSNAFSWNRSSVELLHVLRCSTCEYRGMFQ